MRNQTVKLIAATMIVMLALVVPAAAQSPEPTFRMFMPMAMRAAKMAEITPTADLYVIENLPDENTGTEDILAAGYDPDPETRFGRLRSYIAFDQINADSYRGLSAAKLKLYYLGAMDEPNQERTVYIRYAGRGWDELTATFNNDPGCGDVIATGVINSDAPEGYVEFDVYLAVSNWQNGMEVNGGFCVSGAGPMTNEQWAYQVFGSRESPTPPLLELTY
jgi:hypothetical protein